MSSDLIKKAPYYDKYDKSKKYTQLLAVPGRVAQAREITEIQSTIKDIIKSLGDSLMNDGNIIEGCQVIPDKVKKKVRVTAGRVYMQGMVFEIKDPQDSSDPDYGKNFVDIKAVGTEIIGLRLKESIVYSDDDSSLLDPALGYENFNQPGMDRLKSEVEIVCVGPEDTDSVAILTTLIDGEVFVEQQAPNYSALNETLARRTYDESGSYIVDGLNVRVESHPSSNELFNIIVEPGKAYVHGYELTIPSSRRISMARSTTATPVTARYTFSQNSKYLLTTGPYVKGITKVTASLLATESLSINNSQGAPLGNNTAYNIVSVMKNDEEIPSSSYRIEQGPTSYLRWSNTSYPGDNVTVKYYYTYEFVEGRDYELYLDENNNYYLNWVNATTVPIEGENISIDYDKYLARKDTVYMDQYGNVSALQGTPADYGFEVSPDAPAYTLPLAAVMSPPGGAITKDDASNINVSNVGLTRFTMSDIHKMLKRIRTMEYDQTIVSLNSEAKEYGIDDMKGIFTDPFLDLTKVSLDFNISEGNPVRTDYAVDASNQNVDKVPYFDVTIDLDGNLLYLPLLSSIVDMDYDPETSTVSRYNRVLSLKKSGERVALSQMKATKSFLVSPYLSYPQSPEIFISPSLDTWFDDTYIEVPVTINQSKVVSTSSRNFYTSSTVNRSYNVGSGSVTSVLNRGTSSSTSVSSSTSTTAVGNTVETLIEENVVREESILYIRPREISVTGKNYPSNLDNINCYFEGLLAPLTPTGTTSAGTLSGSVKADSKGAFTAKFTIPEKVLTGTRVVELKSDIVIDGYNSSASTFYQATGTARTIEKTISTVNTVLLERVTNYYYHTTVSNFVTYQHTDPDPLAQTFILDTMTLLSGVDIYFESVPEVTAGGIAPAVTCEIREVKDGNITSKIYGFKTLTANEINVSSNSSVATRFNFNDPVLIEPNTEYAFVLKSPSQDFRVFVAEIGEIDILSNERVTSNPYLLGVMMSSSNNMSWTNHQKADVKFQLIADTYERNSEIFFHNVDIATGFCRYYLTAESLVFEGTSLEWYYSIDEGLNYSRLTPYNIGVLDQLASKIALKAKLSRSANTSISPLLALDSVSMSLECYDNEKEGYYYVSKLISGLDPYTHLDLYLDTNEPSGTDLKVYISTDDNNANPYHMLPVPKIDSTEMNYGWWERHYALDLSSEKTQCRIFVKLSSNTKYRTPAFRRLRAIMS